MAWQDNLAKLFGGGAYGPESGVTPEMQKAAALQGLLGAGTSLLANSGYTDPRAPVSTSAALGQAFGAAQQGFQGGINQGLQGEELAAKRKALQDEQAAREELDTLLASGNITQEALLRIATRYPGAQNVIQQYLKGMQGQAAPQGPSELQSQQLPDGSTVFWDGKRWQRAPAQQAPRPAADPAAGIQAKIEALRGLGTPDDQIATALGVRPPGAAAAPKPGAAPGAAPAGGGFNPRQLGGARQAANEAINYAAALTGLPPTQLQTMSPEELEKTIVEQGARFLQGPVLGEIPLVSDRVNADLTPVIEAMAAAQALVNNPTGPVTKPDVDTARVTAPNAKQPIEVQAKRIRNLIEQLRNAEGAAAAAPQAPPQAIEYLRANPQLAPAFDAKYGPGAAAQILEGM